MSQKIGLSIEKDYIKVFLSVLRFRYWYMIWISILFILFDIVIVLLRFISNHLRKKLSSYGHLSSISNIHFY